MTDWVVAVARISAMGTRKYLGRFDTEQEAAQAYKQFAKNLHGEFSGV
jgi:hypothetical protein